MIYQFCNPDNRKFRLSGDTNTLHWLMASICEGRRKATNQTHSKGEVLINLSLRLWLLEIMSNVLMASHCSGFQVSLRSSFAFLKHCWHDPTLKCSFEFSFLSKILDAGASKCTGNHIHYNHITQKVSTYMSYEYACFHEASICPGPLCCNIPVHSICQKLMINLTSAGIIYHSYTDGIFRVL